MSSSEKYFELDRIVKIEKLSVLLPLFIELAEELDDVENKNWALLELHGYTEDNKAYRKGVEIPDYRSIVGEFHDFQGRPLIITEKKYEFINTVKLQQGVIELEDWSRQDSILVTKPIALFEMLRKLGVAVHEFDFHSSGIKTILSKIRSEIITRLKIFKPHNIDFTTEDKMFVEIDLLHPGIVKTSKKLFNDGHYRQAVLDAFIYIIDYVKIKSGMHDLDGVPLMQTVFSAKNPVVQLSKDSNQQLGYMWLFSGSVMGIRNFYAHKLIEIIDKQEAIELLCLASSLLRILDKNE